MQCSVLFYTRNQSAIRIRMILGMFIRNCFVLVSVMSSLFQAVFLALSSTYRHIHLLVPSATKEHGDALTFLSKACKHQGTPHRLYIAGLCPTREHWRKTYSNKPEEDLLSRCLWLNTYIHCPCIVYMLSSSKYLARLLLVSSHIPSSASEVLRTCKVDPITTDSYCTAAVVSANTLIHICDIM